MAKNLLTYKKKENSGRFSLGYEDLMQYKHAVSENSISFFHINLLTAEYKEMKYDTSRLYGTYSGLSFSYGGPQSSSGCDCQLKHVKETNLYSFSEHLSTQAQCNYFINIVVVYKNNLVSASWCGIHVYS